jgi:hypothetical protein
MTVNGWPLNTKFDPTTDWFLAELFLPRSITHHDCRLCSRAIVGLGKHAPGVGANADHAEVVSGHILKPTTKIRPTFFLAEAQWRQHMPNEDPRFQAFEDRSHFLNSVVIVTRGTVPGLEQQVLCLR